MPSSHAADGRRAARGNVLIIGVLIITFVLHLLVIAEPFGRDQGIFGYIGQTIVRGGVPYRDAWDHKTPGLYGVYALAFLLFGDSMASLHLLEGIALTITAFFLYLIGCRLWSAGIGLLGALLYGMAATLLFEWWDPANAEIYMGLTGTLAVYALLRSLLSAHGRTSLHIGWLALSAILCSLTISFKPSGIFLLAGFGLAVLVFCWRTSVQCIGRGLAVLVLASGASFIPLVVYFAANGALNDVIQAVFIFNSYHARIGGNPTIAGSVSGTLDFLASMNILSPLALVGLWDVWRRRHTSRGLTPAFVMLTIWLIASATGIWTQGKFFSYHWSSLLPPLALVAAWGAGGIADELRRMQRGTVRLFAALICLAVVVIYGTLLVRDHVPKWTRDASYLLGYSSSAEYLANFGHNIGGRDKYSFLETQQTAHYLRDHTNAEDRVLVWGFQALVNFLADRRAPTRYIFTYPLTFDRPESAFRVEARRRFLRDLKENPPLYVVLVTNDLNPLQAVDSYQLLAGFPEFGQILQQQYRIEENIGEFHLYRRIGA